MYKKRGGGAMRKKRGGLRSLGGCSEKSSDTIMTSTICSGSKRSGGYYHVKGKECTRKPSAD